MKPAPAPPISTLVIVPLYRNAELVRGLFDSLISSRADFERLQARILLINDSPDDSALARELEMRLPGLAAVIGVDLLVNPSNLGFVGSANIGLGKAHAAGCDAILLNSDTLLTPGALEEMAVVARQDPMIGFVSPRSNNATLCNSPYPERFRALGFGAAVDAHRQLQAYLPRWAYVPTAVGFCLLVRWFILDEFGLFDPIYGGGYNEETDLILRANRRGYRAVLANHAFVYHLGSQSFSLTTTSPLERERENRAVLLARYPTYARAVERYFAGAEFAAQSLLAGVLADAEGRRGVLFDASYMGAFHNGTFEMNRRLLEAFVQAEGDRYACHILCSEEVFAFHRLGEIDGLAWVETPVEALGPFFACIRLSQPNVASDLRRPVALAPIVVMLMHDTISLDCMALDESDLSEAWQQLCGLASVLLYVSDFSMRQFNRRFAVPERVVQMGSLLSTDVAEYRPATAMAGSGDAILVVGNHYAHKAAAETAEALLARAPGRRVILLGVELPAQPGLSSYRAGEIDQETIEQLYAAAAVVVFPSHYEGFGLPLMHALAHRKPVIARRLPPFEEIARHLPERLNLHLASSTTELLALAGSGLSWTDASAASEPARRWRDVAADLATALEQAHRRLDYAVLRQRVLPVGAEPPAVAPQLHQPRPEAGVRRPRGPGRWQAGIDRLIWRMRMLGADLLSAIGDRCRDQGDFAGAANAYGAALHRDPTMTAIWVQYGHALKETGRPAKALAAYGKALALAPELADSHLQIGHAYKIARRFRESRDAYARALELDPDMEDARSELSRLAEVDSSHMRRAALTARRAVSSAPAGEVSGWVVANGPLVLGAGVGLSALETVLGAAKSEAEPLTAFITAEPDAATALALVSADLERVVIAHPCGRARDQALDLAPFAVERGLLADEIEVTLRYPAEVRA